MVQGPGVGRDCAIFSVEDKNRLLTSLETVIADQPDRVRQVICHAVNNIRCMGGAPMGISLSILLPESAQESDLRALMDAADEASRELGIGIAGGHTEVSAYVKSPVVTAGGIGSSVELEEKKMAPGLDLVMTGWAGTEGTAILARRKEEELLKKFPLDLVVSASGFDEHLSLETESSIAWECEAMALHDVSQGGIFGALWEMCERHGVGMEAELKKIPLRQETVEICEQFGLNPYCLLSGGVLLAAVRDGQRLVTELDKAGIPASVIGRTTDKKDKVLRNGEEVRFLEKPAQDEIFKV